MGHILERAIRVADQVARWIVGQGILKMSGEFRLVGAELWYRTLLERYKPSDDGPFPRHSGSTITTEYDPGEVILLYLPQSRHVNQRISPTASGRSRQRVCSTDRWPSTTASSPYALIVGSPDSDGEEAVVIVAENLKWFAL